MEFPCNLRPSEILTCPQIGTSVVMKPGCSFTYDYQLQTYTVDNDTNDLLKIKEHISTNGIVRVGRHVVLEA